MTGPTGSENVLTHGTRADDQDMAEFEADGLCVDIADTTCIHHNDEERKSAGCPVCQAERIAELENIAAVAIANRKSMHRRAEQAEAQLAEHRSTDMKVTMAYLRRREDELEAETEEVRNQSAQDFDRVCENLRASEAELAEAREEIAQWRYIAESLPARGVGISDSLQARINRLYSKTPTEGGTS